MTEQELRQTINSLDLSQRVICLHSSLRSLGHVVGGAEALVEAFLAEGCTLLVPAFHFSAQVEPPEPSPWLRNGGAQMETKEKTTPAYAFDPGKSGISPGMGAIPEAVVAHPNAFRGNHSLNSLAAVGPQASQLIAAQDNDDVYGPYRQAAQQQRSVLLLLGVDLTKATPLHFAEQLAGRQLFRRWALQPDGSSREVTIGSCSHGFEILAGPLALLEQKRYVGSSCWRWYPLSEFLDTAASLIRSQPLITHCHQPDCLRCDDAVAGGPVTNASGSLSDEQRPQPAKM